MPFKDARPGRLTATACLGALIAAGFVRPSAAGNNLPVPCATGTCGTSGPNTWLAPGSHATRSQTSSTLNINQQSQQAILNWSSFNIAAGSAVKFNQPSTSAIALNQIYDNNPSTIFGNLTANGQVFLINQNGFLFGPHATVNVNTLVASSLGLSNQTFLNGILNPSLLSGHTPAFASDGRTDVTDQNGNLVLNADGQPTPVAVTVEQGASISTASGGRIMLLGQQVTNAGSLTSPSGQVILAAGQKAYLQASDDPNLRGLVVEVDGGGPVANQLSGAISTPTGNTTLVGLAVNQQGRISATTSVSANGSITLQAADTTSFSINNGSVVISASETGSLELGSHSVTAVVPDLASSATAVDAQAQSPSIVDLTGHQIHLDGGASVIANGGQVNIQASADAAPITTATPTDPESQVRIDTGATIDVSGSSITLPMSANIVTAQLRGTELADYPQQRNGALRGQTVYVDVRADGGLGTTVANVSGEIQAVPRSIGQRTAAGGTVNIQSQGDAVLAPGSVVNVSGGSVSYTGGVVATTELVASDGTIHDIGSADPNMTYIGVINPTVSITHYKWGFIDNFPLVGGAHYEAGYVQGYNAGALDIAARSIVLNGTLLGKAVAGPYQRSPYSPSCASTGTCLSSQLALVQPQGGELQIGAPDSSDTDFLAPSVTFRSDVLPIVVAPGEPIAGTLNTLDLSTQYLTSGGFTRTAIYSDGQIQIPAGLPLQLAPDSTFSLTAPRIDVLSSIASPGGTLSLAATPVLDQSVLLYTGTGGLSIGNGVSFDMSGRWVNDAPTFAGASPMDSLAINGGSIALSVGGAGDVLSIGDNAQLNVSAGAHAAAYGSIGAGTAGKITLAAGAGDTEVSIGSGLRLSGYGIDGSAGGSLTIAANRIEVTHNPTTEIAPQTVDFGKASATALDVADGLFERGGFTNFSLYATGPVGGPSASGTQTMSAPGVVQPLVIDGNARIDVNPGTLALASSWTSEQSGAALSSFSSVGPQPLDVVPAAQLTFGVYTGSGAAAVNSTVNPANGGSLVVKPGAAISVNPGSTVTFSSITSIDMSGTVKDAGGAINFEIPNPSQNGYGLDPGYQAAQGIYLEPGSVLDVAGTTEFSVSSIGLRQGTVLPGGMVNFIADRGSVFAEAGALINVSGSHDVLDLPVGTAGGYSPQTVASVGGSITIVAPESITLAATLLGRSGAPAGAAGPAGGSLSITLSREDGYQPNPNPDNGLPPVPDTPRTLVVGDITQPGSSFQSTVNPAPIEAGGFSSLTLAAQDVIDILGGTSMRFDQALALQAPNIGALGAAPISLQAPYVSLGPTNVLTQATDAPSAGPASLSVQAGLIQLNGNLSLQGFGQTTLTASSDLQAVGVLTTSNNALVGSLSAAGTLTLAARQIYPTTLSQFAISVTGGTIDTRSTGAAEPVLSAGGQLSMSASQINNAGSIEAPFGVINLNAADSLTLAPGSLVSVSGDGATIPFGETQNGAAWVYYLTNLYFLPITAPPAKQVLLSAPKVSIAAGAKVDISGGGDLYAYEFVPGLGGTTDALSPSVSPNSYAVIPGLHTYAPVDALYDTGSSLAPGAAVYLSGIPGQLAAGTYTLLPARYALLPGAFLITVQPGEQDLPLGQTASLENGAPVVSGYFTTLGTNFRSGRTVGFSIEPGSYANQLAEYDPTSANAFFAAQAASSGTPVPQLPIDAGTLAFNVETSLALDGTIDSKAGVGGRGALVDVSAQNLTIVSSPTAGATGVDITAASLESLGAQSLLIGGTRSTVGGSEVITVAAQETALAPGTSLSAPEVLLVGQDAVTVGAGASLTATGAATGLQGGAVTLSSTSGSSALVRVSTGGQIQLTQAAPNSSSGTTDVAQGAVLSAPGSITLAGTRDTISQGTLESKGSVSLTSSHISLGDVSPGTSGLVLTDAQLAALGTVSDLELITPSSIDFYGAISLGSTSAPGQFSLGSLLLDAPALRGFGPGSATLSAGAVELDNNQGTPSAAASGTGTGALKLAGNSLEFGAGSYGFSGFEKVTLASRGDIVASGTAVVAASSNLTLQSHRIIGMSGANLAIDAVGAFDTLAAPLDASLPTQTPGLGVIFSVAANSIDHAGSFDLSTGFLTLAATKGLTLERQSSINVAGTVRTLADYSVSTPGGAVVLDSSAGNLSMASGASINVSGGAGGGAAGSLTVDTGGNVELSGALLARSATGSGGGSFSVQAGQIVDFGSLVSALSAGGFSTEQDFTTGSGALTLAAGSTIRAQNVSLTANGGALIVNGTIDARAPSGGAVALNAAGDLTLGTGGVIRVDATGAGESGGTVELNTEGGSLATLGGSTISAGGAGGGGQVIFRAPAAGNDVAITGLDGSIEGAGNVIVRVLNVYNDVGTVDATLQGQLAQDFAGFSTTASTIAARLGQSANPAFSVEAAVELRNAGDMTVADPWDLSAFRPNGLPGELTLRAAGNLNIYNTLSDGMSENGTLVPLAGPSWSYRLTAGADLSSANPNATLAASQVAAGSGNVVIGSGVAVRTGTGSITVDAAANVQFTDQTSVLYTSGVPVAGLTPQTVGAGTFNWTDGGGNIAIHAGVDVIGAMSNQVVTAWQLRRNLQQVAQWGIDFDNFQENVGTLGGGNVTVVAGRDVIDLSAMLPTSGVTDPVSHAVSLYGGGNLTVLAGRNVTSGVYYVGDGVGNITARGSLEPDETVDGLPLGTILALGQGSLNVTAGNGLEIESVLNPTVVGQPISGTRNLSTFFTYSPTSSVSLTALAGTATVEANDQTFETLIGSAASANNGEAQETWLPSHVTIAALTGDINVQGQTSLYLFPSADGNLVLAAENNLALGNLYESAVNPAVLPGPANPYKSAVGLAGTLSTAFTLDPYDLHAGDSTPTLFIAAQGDIALGSTNSLQIPKSVEFIAGRDITDIQLSAENQSRTDVTLLQAGRDITYSSTSGGIDLGGPGYLDLFAGRNIDLGASNGITTAGTIENPTLPGTSGATVNVLAGLTEQPAYQSFITRYFGGQSIYSSQLAAFVSSVTGVAGLTPAATLSDFEALPSITQLPLILTAFFNELNQSGLEATAGQKPGYARGYDAINTLFPGSLNAAGQPVSSAELPYAGDLSLSFSRIYTLGGGDINLLVPGGLIDVGLANPPPNAPNRTPAELGIVAQGPGSVNAFTYGDVDVNQSRVFTLDGGSILIWSSAGNIDAGRGAKTAISAPAPTITVDPNSGQVTINLAGAVAGSGIRTIITDPSVPPGNVNLIAPIGTVNAGDAGIGSAGNINIAAQTVLGASNINFGGTASGVPASTSNVAAGLTGVSNTSSSASNAAVEAATANNAVEKSASLADSALGWLDVFVTGLGEENCKPDDVECLKRQKRP
jgi:filamentous hemagglutinin family protein